MKIVLTVASLLAASYGDITPPKIAASPLHFQLACRIDDATMTCRGVAPGWMSVYDVQVHNQIRCALAKTPMYIDALWSKPETGMIDGVYRWKRADMQSVDLTVNAPHVGEPVAYDVVQMVEFDMPKQPVADVHSGCGAYKVEISRRHGGDGLYDSRFYDIFAFVE